MIYLGDGGGNILPKESVTVRRTAAIGDCISSTVVADKLLQQGIQVDFQCHPSIVPLLRRCESIRSVSLPHGHCDVNLDNCYEKDPHRKTTHFHDFWVRSTNSQLKYRSVKIDTKNCRPRLRVLEDERAFIKSRLVEHQPPFTFVCPRSQWFACRSVPDYIWSEAAKKIVGTKFWIGMHPAPPGFVDLHCKSIDEVAVWLTAADLLITTDTGPLHVAAAVGTQVLAIRQSSSPDLHLSDLNDYETIGIGLDCENCQLNLCPKGEHHPPCQDQNPEKIAEAANRKLVGAKVSCLIPTFNCPPNRLKRCIDAVLPQVDEVIVTAAADGVFPTIGGLSPKIQYVRSPKSDIGFGKNVNFGFRHTSGKHVLVLNDDAFLNPGCVEELLRQTGPNIGMVAHLLRFESGRIYFAGRQRIQGGRGCHHVDYNQWTPSIAEPREMEALSATSLLINREAFYRSGGFNERFHMYAEDDDISLRIRRHGYKLIYTPHATGVHVGSATSGPTGQIGRWIGESGKLMEELWGPYWDYNRNRIPGTFDYC